MSLNLLVGLYLGIGGLGKMFGLVEVGLEVGPKTELCRPSVRVDTRVLMSTRAKGGTGRATTPTKA